MSQYQPEKGTEDYVHILVSHKQGQAIEPPQIELYRPVNVAAVMGLKGFKGEIQHDPRTAAQKKQVAPATDTVKMAAPLAGADKYRARYEQLFHEAAPLERTEEEIKRIVDRAEAKLAEAIKGVEPTEPETDEQRLAREAKEAQAAADAADGLPTNKTEWFTLFQKEFPGDTTAYADITVPQIRTKLGK